MVYFTGDTHGSAAEVVRFCNRFILTAEDTIVILGDVGANFCLDERDIAMKTALCRLEPTILCIHGNHEIRPANIPSYITKDWNGGTVWYEEAFPNILFARDGDIYTLEGIKYLVIGGAYSVDKFYRISRGYGWWEDEQPSDEIKAYVERQIAEKHFDVILSHTCPFKYEPTEVFLPSIDQSTVDDSTEHWLDKIEAAVEYKAWFCGHWHIDKRIDKMHFLFHGYESAEQFGFGGERSSLGTDSRIHSTPEKSRYTEITTSAMSRAMTVPCTPDTTGQRYWHRICRNGISSDDIINAGATCPRKASPICCTSRISASITS